MRSRAVREGSVGLMLIVGLAVFGAIFYWMKGLAPGAQSYNIIAKFSEAPGLQLGGPIRFRGIKVGKIAKIEPGANAVEVVMQIEDTDLTIPKDATIEISQTGLIGEPVLEILPRTPVTLDPKSVAKALDSRCNPNLILCNNAKVNGEVGASFNELLRKASKLVELYNNPQLLANLNATLTKTGTAAEDFSRLGKNFSKLTTEFSSLPKSVESGLNKLSVKADVLTTSLDRTSTKIGNTADRFNTTATRLNETAIEYKKLATSVNGLVVENRRTFTTSLNNFNQLSQDLRKTVRAINPTIGKLNTTVSKINSDKLTKELESVLSNANQTAVNLKQATATLGDPKTVLILQQTLDSARTTFQNTQKITSDLDDLTGSPEFRSNLRNLVNGLGKLVSSTEQLEQQAKLAQTIEPLGQSLEYISKLPRVNYATQQPANSLSETDRSTQPNTNNSFMDRPNSAPLSPRGIVTPMTGSK